MDKPGQSEGHDGTPDHPGRERCEIVELPVGTIAVYCAKSPIKATPNEDGAVIVQVDDDRAVLAVADGMGGQPDGHQASDIALRAVAERVETYGAAGLREAILDGFESANARVTLEASGSGTTLAAVEIDHSSIRPYHVGDSVVLVFGQRGRLKLETVAHSPVGYAVEAGLLDASAAMHHHERHLVSNFVGSPEMHIEMGPALRLRPRDTVVLGSDGLFDNLHVEEIIELVRKGPLDRAADQMAAACRQRMLAPEPGHPSKADDVTFIVFRPRAGQA